MPNRFHRVADGCAALLRPRSKLVMSLGELPKPSDAGETPAGKDATSLARLVAEIDLLLIRDDVPAALVERLTAVRQASQLAIRERADRRQSEAALLRSERLYRAVGESIDFGIWVCNPDGLHVYASDSFLKLTGLTQEQLSAGGWGAVLHPDDVGSTMAAWRACMQLGGAWDREHRVRGADGKFYPVLARGVPVRDDSGELLYWAGINLDISRLKLAEEQLRESERRLQAVIDNAAALISVKDRRGRYVLINRCFEDSFQITRNEVFGKLDHTFFPSDLADEYIKNDQVVFESGRSIEVEETGLHHDGLHNYISIKFPLRHADGQTYAICSISTDITARKQTEAALRESEQRFRRLVETANEGIWVVDAFGQTLFANQRMAEMLGCTTEEMAGRRLTDFVFADDLTSTEHRLGRNLQGHTDTFDSRFRRKNGAEVLVLGGTTPVEDSDGRIVGALGMFSDITDRRRAEDALKEADRRKDEFLAMLAHELRNPLAAISSAHELSQLPDVPEQERGWAGEVIGRQLGQLTAIIDDLLDVSRITRGKIQLKLQPVRLDEIARRAELSLRPLIDEHRHTLTVSLPDAPLWIEADPNRVEQVLVNLLNNACKYTADGGQLELQIRRHAGVATIAVKDSGVGIAAEMLPKIFDLFAQADHSLDRSKGGLGIGLTLVKKLVAMHGGAIGAFSDGLGTGSSFVVEFPLLPDAQIPGEATAIVADTGAAKASILIVDDNVDASRGLGLLLRGAGHAVEVAHQGEAALALAAALQPGIVLLDIGLPGMDGYEVARRLRATPALGSTVIIAISGYGQPEDRKRAGAAGFDHHLVKPVATSELLALLTRVGRASSAAAHSTPAE